MLAIFLLFGSVVGFLCTCEVGEGVYQAPEGIHVTKRGSENNFAFFSPLLLQDHLPSLSAHGWAAERSRNLMWTDSHWYSWWSIEDRVEGPCPGLGSNPTQNDHACIREGPWKTWDCFAPLLGVAVGIHQNTKRWEEKLSLLGWSVGLADFNGGWI